MGLFDSLFGGGDDKTETKQTYSPFITAAQELQQKGALDAMAPYLKNPQAYVAPLNPYQEAVGAGAQGLVDYGKATNYAGQLTDYSSQYLALGGMPGGNADILNQYIPGYSQQAIDASTIDMGDIAAFANPYAEALTDAGMRRLDQSYQSSQRDIGAQAAAGGAFGGSGEYIRRNMLDEDRMNSARDLAVQAKSDAYGIGAQLAGQNAAAQSAALQQAGNDIYGRALGSATYGDNVRNDQFNRQLAGLQGASQYGLSMAGANNGFANDYTTRQLQSLGLLGGYGDLVRQQAQQQGDQNYTSFARMASLIPGVQPTQTTTQPTNNTGLLGTALTAYGMFGK